MHCKGPGIGLMIFDRNYGGSTFKRCILTLTSAIALICGGCVNGIVRGNVENQIEKSLPGLIGPADSYKVEVHGSSAKMIRGRIGEILIHGAGVRIIPNLRLDGLDVKLTDVVADRKNSSLKSVGATEFEATIQEKSLNDYLSHTRKDESRAKLLSDTMIVTARPKVLRIPASMILTGVLVPKNDKLNFHVERLKVIGLNAPSVGVKLLEDWINPIVDLGKTGFSPRFTSVVIESGAIKIIGTADLAGKGLSDLQKH